MKQCLSGVSRGQQAIMLLIAVAATAMMISITAAQAANVTYAFDPPPANLAPLPDAILQQAMQDADLLAARAAVAGKDGKTATVLYRKAIAAGNVVAMVELADLEDHDNEGLVRIDMHDADALYHRAALAGYAVAQYRVGELYEEGDGLNQDRASALIWYRLAADQGMDQAVIKMAFEFLSGGSDKKNIPLALHYATLGEQAGGHDSRCLLALFYLNGIGVPEDDARAFHLVFLAAEQGDPEAQDMLARMYAHGRGIQTDFDQAQHWEDLSKKTGWPEDDAILPLPPP
jgi:TPR repeat protein